MKGFANSLNVVTIGVAAMLVSGCTSLDVMDNWFFSRGVPEQAQVEKNNKNTVQRYWRFYNNKDYDVLKQTVAENLAQHSSQIKDGRAALVEIFREQFFQQAPEYHVQIKRIIADGDLVFVHSHATAKKADRGKDSAQPSYAVADIYRLKDGQIVEHWDVLQQVPAKPSANGNTMFNGGGFKTTSPDVEKKNKDVVLRYMEEFINKKNFKILDEIMSVNSQAHSPKKPNGRENLKTFARTQWFVQFPEVHAQVKRIGAEGNLVFVQSHYTLKKQDRGNDWAPNSSATVDIFRLEDGIIVEHWDVVFLGLPLQTASGRSLFDGGGMFAPSTQK